MGMKKSTIGIAAVVVIAAGGGTITYLNHDTHEEKPPTHKIKESSAKSESKEKSSMSSSTSESSMSSEASTADSVENSLAPANVPAESSSLPAPSEDEPEVTPQDTQSSGISYDTTTLSGFINTYGTTPAGWLVQNKGMSVKDALFATPDEMQTSGEIQDEYMYQQGIDPVQAYQDAKNNGEFDEYDDQEGQTDPGNTGWSDATE